MEKTGQKTNKALLIVAGLAGVAAVSGLVIAVVHAGAKPQGIVKKAGDIVSAEIVIRGRGVPGRFQVGMGLVPSGSKAAIQQWLVQTVSIPLTDTLSNMPAITVSGQLNDLGKGDIDAVMFVQLDAESLDDAVHGNAAWEDTYQPGIAWKRYGMADAKGHGVYFIK